MSCCKAKPPHIHRIQLREGLARDLRIRTIIPHATPLSRLYFQPRSIKISPRVIRTSSYCSRRHGVKSGRTCHCSTAGGGAFDKVAPRCPGLPSARAASVSWCSRWDGSGGRGQSRAVTVLFFEIIVAIGTLHCTRPPLDAITSHRARHHHITQNAPDLIPSPSHRERPTYHHHHTTNAESRDVYPLPSVFGEGRT